MKQHFAFVFSAFFIVSALAPLLVIVDQSGEADAAGASPVMWTRYAGNPVLSQGAGGSWESTCIYTHCVINDSGTYKMWYGGSTKPYIEEKIGYATSPDGKSWTKYAGNPVMSLGVPGSWDSTRIGSMSVLKDGSTYKMWYYGTNGAIGRIGYATSTDGIIWTRCAGNPVLDLGASNTWDSREVGPNCVIKENDVYKIWYGGSDGSHSRVGLAESTDGIIWNRYAGNPVIGIGASNSWDDFNVGYLCVVNASGIYYGWYGGDSGTNWGIGYARSTDGKSWTKYASNPIMTQIGNGWEKHDNLSPWVLLNGPIFQMWYTGVSDTSSPWVYKFGYAEGSNPSLFAPIPTFPPDGSWTNQGKPVFRWTFNDSNPGDVQGSYQLQLADDSDFASVRYESGRVDSAAGTHTPGSPMPDGSYFWRVQAWTANDECSGWSVVQRIGIDTTPPLIFDLTINDGNNVTSSRVVRIHALAEDPEPGSGVNKMRIRTDGANWSAWQEYKDETTFQLYGSDGNRSIDVQMMDRAGNPSPEAGARIFLDTGMPMGISLAINDGQNLTNSTSVVLTVDATDPAQASGLQQMAFGNDGLNWGDWETFSRVCSYTLLAGDGKKTVYLKVRDRAGNIGAIASASIILDGTPPTCTVAQLPANVDDWNFTVNWNGSDATSGILAYDLQYRKDGGDWTDWFLDTTNASATFTGEDGHNYSFRARAQDRACNRGAYPVTGSGPVKIDIPVPVVTILRPSAGSVVSGMYTTAGTAIHPNMGMTVELVRIQLDGKPWQDASGTGNWSYKFDSMILRNGMHTLNVSAFDGTKYSNVATVELNVDNKVTVSDNMLVWAALLILISVVIGLTAFFGARRMQQPLAPQEGYGINIPPSDGDGPNEVQVPHPPAVGMAPEPASAGPERGRMAVVGSISVDELEETPAPGPERTLRQRQPDEAAAREGQVLRAIGDDRNPGLFMQEYRRPLP
jgi:hypothetical protein